MESNAQRNCFFFDHIFFGFCDIVIFNQTMMMGFRTYTVFNNLYEFAVNKNLPNKNIKKRNIKILKAIWITSGCNLCLYVFMNIYWTFINRDIYNLRIYNFVNSLLFIFFIMLNAMLFVFAVNLITKTLNHTIVDNRQTNLLRASKIMMSFAITFIMLSMTLTWGLFTQGFTDIWALLNWLSSLILYLIT